MAQTKSIEVMDGSRIKALVNDTRAFASYVDAKFCTLDKSKNGRLSREELMPIALAVGNALGLPPQGSSPNADHIYDEVLSEFLQGQKESITKEEFTPILRDMLLGVADGLERDPVMLRTLNGEALERYVKSTQFETDAVQLFSEMAGDNDAVNGDCIKRAIQKMSIEQGMPPASDGKILKGIVEPSLQSVGTNGSRRYTQDEFMKALRQSLNAIASWMREKPVTVAHTEKCFDGSAIATLLKDEPVLQQILNDTWKSLGPFKSDDGMLLKSNIRTGLDLLGPYAGLPPVGAVDEWASVDDVSLLCQMDRVIEESIKLVDLPHDGFLDKNAFSKCTLEILGGIMLQLQGKPIKVSSNVPAATDQSSDDCLRL